MGGKVIRPAYSTWPDLNRALRDVVAGLTPAQLALQPSPQRWPLWATVGHLACQRVFWLCDAVGEPGAAATPFPNAGYDCPGDDDLENVLGPEQLAEALDSTFRIVEQRLDGWTLEMLGELVVHPEWEPGWAYTRGAILQRVYAHDVYHTAEANEILSRAGLPLVGIWD
jgi:uncharacterized damage-inducible protein DinB